jgi:hypothetical protein
MINSKRVVYMIIHIIEHMSRVLLVLCLVDTGCCRLARSRVRRLLMMHEELCTIAPTEHH